MHIEHRRIGDTNLSIAPVALGCWPMAGVTTTDVSDADSVATIREAAEHGINHLDTAYVYGRHGESDRLIRQAIEGVRDKWVIASKVGVHWQGAEMQTCGRPETLRRECDELLQRLGTDHVELLYLHSPDPQTPIAASAEALGQLQAEGKTLAVGVSNCSLEQIVAFHAVTPIAAVQLPYNMLQRDIERKTLPWCREHHVSALVYWPLMKGLLAGKLPRDHVFAADDSRRDYPMYQGEEWERNQDFVDVLRELAEEHDCTVAQLVIAWTIAQPGITAALCGAKRPSQIRETAEALRHPLTTAELSIIDQAIIVRGHAAAKRVFE
jgi:aryl-alcohol dehydrogenase-like predicted oxidoreductase